MSPTLTHISTTGESALVTGAGAGGIAGAIATALALSVISTICPLSRSESRLLETSKHLQEIALKTLTQIYIANLTDRPAVQRAATSIAATIPSGTIDIRIANTGYLTDLSSAEAAEAAEWWKGFPGDEVALSGDFVTWAVSPEARFLTDDLCGRIVMLMS